MVMKHTHGVVPEQQHQSGGEVKVNSTTLAKIGRAVVARSCSSRLNTHLGLPCIRCAIAFLSQKGT